MPGFPGLIICDLVNILGLSSCAKCDDSELIACSRTLESDFVAASSPSEEVGKNTSLYLRMENLI